MVSSTPAGSGLPIGLMPGALPSDQASRQTLNTTAMRLPFGQTQFGCCFMRFSPWLRLNHTRVRICSPDERSDIRGAGPAYRCAHAGY